MKIFIRANETGVGERPSVIASYPDDTDVKDDAHGPGMQVVILPSSAIIREFDEERQMIGHPRLVPDWRERAAAHFPASERVASTYELLSYLIEHGADVARWPTHARDRLAKIKYKWKQQQ